ncbi:MAG: UDP-4-amino-4-deoxy-L-arabinose aminotransferase [Victivallaceae bacterium]|nr:UDP-4-amino-4-deoxy-L-arabinose aminotransferase [Victivallaceae bacterium]
MKTRDKFLPFSKPSINEATISAVGDVLRSGWITTGPNCSKFETAICQYTDSKHAIALASATAGMHILLKALDIGPGDEVITPSLTWVSTINLITLSGATPVFADVDRDTLMITPESVKAVMSARTKLIIPVHYAGAAADLDGIKAVTDEYGIPVVEDAAHAIGTAYKGRHIGQSLAAIYSFHPIKNITTGEGGMFTTDDDELAAKIKQLKFHGLGVDAFDRNTQGRSPQAEVLTPGYKYNMSDIAAVIGVKQLAELDRFNARRTELAKLYLEKLAGIDELLPLALPKYEFKHAWHLFIVRIVSDKLDRDAFIEAMKKRNIGIGLHFRAVHLQKYYRENMPLTEGALPNTVWNSDRICSLPLFPAMTEQDIDDVITAIKDVMK